MSVTWLVAMILAQAVPRAQSPAPDETAALAATREAPTLPASIDVRNQMGKRFRLIEARVSLDGLELSKRTAAHGEELEHSFRAYDGAVSAGDHTVTVTLVYEGRNAGPFTYLDDYKFRVESTAVFTAHESARPTALQVIAYERPGATIPLEQKPTMEIKPAADSSATPALQSPALTGR